MTLPESDRFRLPFPGFCGNAAYDTIARHVLRRSRPLPAPAKLGSARCGLSNLPSAWGGGGEGERALCGITGIWNLDGRPVGQPDIDRFTDSLAHRGPDGRGTWRDASGSVALGHRRLAILDLSASGHQPMSYADGRLWITFNGEIYNFVELRRELEALGHRFRSESDTETILAAYAEWGSTMLLRFNGMWAFAIFDTRERQLFLARDRFGVKPLLFRRSATRFAFASELKAFGHLEGYSPSIDQESAAVSLRTSFDLEASRRTLFSGVERLQPGHFAVVREDGVSLVRWWNTLDHLVEAPLRLEDQAEVFRGLFDDSVRLRMRSDVAIGTCLSGGFDSSAVVCTLADVGRRGQTSRQARDWHRAFVATFPGALNDEREKAECVVAHAGLRCHWLPIMDSDALPDLERVLFDFDDVYRALPTAPWMIYRELRRGRVFVSLDGHGGDELMAGYPPYDWLFFRDAPPVLAHPARNWRLLRDYGQIIEALTPGMGAAAKHAEGLRALLRVHPSFAPLRGLRRRLLSVRSRKAPAAPVAFLKPVAPPPGDDFRLVSDGDRLPPNWSHVNRSLYRMFHGSILPTILRNFDRLSMAHGVEIRMPFMDWRLVTFLFSLPAESKTAHGYTKRVAREAMKGRMPEAIRTSRSKVGFHSPLPEWLNGPLQPWVRGLLASRGAGDHPLVDTAALAAFIERTGSTRSWSWQNCETVWPFLNYLWFEECFPSLSARTEKAASGGVAVGPRG